MVSFAARVPRYPAAHPFVFFYPPCSIRILVYVLDYTKRAIIVYQPNYLRT